MTFGKQLKAWREEARLTQTQLAALAKVSVPYISNLERDFSPNTRSGKPRASVEICERLAKALKRPAAEVIYAAGHVPEGDLPKPKTYWEMAAALERLGIPVPMPSEAEGLDENDLQEWIERIILDDRLIRERKKR